MASSSSHNNNNGIPVATLLEWCKIRDTFFGHNGVNQNIPLAIEMASSCGHPDARWLTEACAGKDVTTKDDAKRVFSALGQNDARALCFAWLLGDQEDLASLRRSAELGFALAQASMAGRSEGEERFKLTQFAAAQGERDGLFSLATCFNEGEGCEKDLDKAKENFLLASELGHVWAMTWLGNLLDELIRGDGDGGAGRQLLETAHGFCLISRNKLNCSIPALEVPLPCLQSDKRCKDM
jgi:TPR repeat protein